MRRTLQLLVLAVLVIAGLAALPAQAAETASHNGQVVSANPANWTPNVLDGEVDALAQVGNMIVVGGSFTQVQAAGGVGPILTRNSIFAFDKDTGEISTSFAPSMVGGVKALAAGPNNTVYVGGKFSDVNGVPAFKIAKLNMSNGTLATGWKPKLVNAIVRDVRYVGGRLFIGGEFTAIGADTRTRLAELDPTTGAVLPFNVPVEGTHFGGQSQVYHMDISPDATKLALVGNFTTVGGQARVEAAMIDLTTNSVSSWATTRYQPQCYTSFSFIVRDVEFSPDGSYFAIGTTGGYGSGSPTLCDSIQRWESNATGPNQDPTWIDYTGGDSTYTVTPTDAAIYYGGHERWMNNPSRADALGPGGVAREGIGALDPVNGLPLSWNPGRDRGQGVFDFLATSDGLFFGSDTDLVAGEARMKLAFFPLAKGTPVPQPGPIALPVKLYQAGNATGSGANVLYRVNAGGPSITSNDGGPNWSSDQGNTSTLRNSGSSTASYSQIPNVNSSVPPGTPSAIFNSERYDPAGGNEMHWNFPVTSGKPITVRLYFANRCTCTNNVGQRKFNVLLDNQTVLSNFDIVADAGTQTGEMKSFDTTSDGIVDIEFRHVLDNPLINGIEIIDRSVVIPPAATGVTQRGYDGSSFTLPTSVADGGVNWSQDRGSFYTNNTLYTAWSDGHLYARDFDGTTFGAPRDINLNGLTNFSNEMKNMTGLFYDHGRIYYTMAGQTGLFARYYTVEDDIVGAGLKDLQPFRVANNLADVDWSRVKGMTLVDGKLYWADRLTGNLNRVDWNSGGAGNGSPVSGTNAVVSGPLVDGRSWGQQALWAIHTAPDAPPTARFTSSCSQLSCDFDGTTSSDADGPVTYSWDFGDGTTSTAAQPHKDYAAGGSFHVVLTVTDTALHTDSVSHDVQVSNSLSNVSYVGSARDNQDVSTSAHNVTVPANVQAGDTLLLYFTDNSASASITAPAGWTQVGTVSTASATTRVWSSTASGGSAGSTVTVTTGAPVKGLLGVTAYRGAGTVDPGDVTMAGETVSRAAHTTPTTTVGDSTSWIVSLWTDKTAATTTWTAPAGELVRNLAAESGSGHPSFLLTDDGASSPSGPVGGLTATADSATANAAMATIVVPSA